MELDETQSCVFLDDNQFFTIQVVSTYSVSLWIGFSHELPKLVNDEQLLKDETSSNLYKKLVSYQETSGQDLSKYISELKDINNRETLHVKNIIDKADGNFHYDDVISGITNNIEDSLRTFKHNLKVHINSTQVVPKRKEPQKGKGRDTAMFGFTSFY